MKKTIILAFFTSSLLFGGSNMLKTGVSNLSVEKTSQKLQEILNKKGIKIFSIFNHSDEAKKVNLQMQDTQVIVFGAPKAGTPLMQCDLEIAIELPLKILIYKNLQNETIVAYKDITNISKNYNTKKCEEVVAKLSKAQENIFNAITN